APHLVEPATDGCDRELGRIGIDADTDEAAVGSYVVDAVRHDLAKLLVLEIVHLHTLFCQAGLKFDLEGLRFQLTATVHQPVVCVPTPWEVGVCPRHPE